MFPLKIAGISDASRTLASFEGKFRTLLHGQKAPERCHTVMMLLRTNNIVVMLHNKHNSVLLQNANIVFKGFRTLTYRSGASETVTYVQF